jgi:DNA-binding FrmR family transcriptional regulator
VRSALKTIELSVLEAHMKSCLVKSCQGEDETQRDQQVGEIMLLLKKYE